MSGSEGCPRCGEAGIEAIAASPLPGVWTVWSCRTCTYLWRSAEPARVSRRASYPDRFRWTRERIDAAPDVPPVTPPSP